jgi:single-strand DNA-binding protein
MASINQATLLGNVGKDPEIRSLNNGSRVASFSIATSERWRDKSSGEQKEKTDWHNVVVFGQGENNGLAGIVEKYVRKGSKLYVQGKIQTRKWQDQGGQDRYTTEIVLSGFDAKLVLLDGKEGGGKPPPPGSADDYRSASGGSSAPSKSAREEIDDEIPF